MRNDATRSTAVSMDAAYNCCPASSSTAELERSASCLLPPAADSCANEETSAESVHVIGMHCIKATSGRRGFFVQSRARDGRVVCSGGDIFRVYVSEQELSRSLYAAISTPVGDSTNSSSAVYFIDVDAGLRLPGRQTYTVRLVLQETQRRSKQGAEGAPMLRWSARAASPTREWFRYRACVDTQVPLPERVRTISLTSPPILTEEPQCGAVSPSTPTALVALGVNDSCGWRCTGEGFERLVRRIPLWSNPRELPDRVKLGYKHVLKPAGCRIHLYGKADLAACMRNQTWLNVGGSAANAVQRGIERISGKCTNWWFNYVRTIGDTTDRSPGVSTFDLGRVATQYIHHPFRFGLLNVLDPAYVNRTAGYHLGPRSKTAQSYERLMCGFDLVVFESGVHDIAFPDAKAGTRPLVEACSGPAPCTDADILPLLHNETHRLDLMAAYRLHVRQLAGLWSRCRDARAQRKRPFRAIFKLAYAPAHSATASNCGAAFGYNVFASYMKGANDVAREEIEASGFEVFDPFPATLHAKKGWFDQGGRDLQHSDALSDLVTQMLLNQICKA